MSPQPPRQAPGRPAARTVFFDLDPGAPGLPAALDRVVRTVEPWLLGGNRLGVLTNTRPGIGRTEIRRLLELAGVDGAVSDELIVVPADLGIALPDRRAFAVAAAIADRTPGECVFVSGNPVLLDAAERAGFQTSELQDGARPSRRRGGAPRHARRAPAAEASTVASDLGPLAVGEIDEDTGPAFILRGRVVTMDGRRRVIEDGRIVVDRGLIRAVLGPGAAVPAGYRSAPEVPVNGTIFPGLIDLHNHYVYNVLPLWPVTRQWQNRTQWADDAGYEREISLPIHALAASSNASRAIVRYIEAKALIGGTTTGQGIRTQVRGGVRLFRGAMRNVEETNDRRLPEAGTRVPNLGRRPVDFAAFKAALTKRGQAGASYFYHLAEGVDAMARRTFTDLRDNDLILPALAGIHGLGLEPEDLRFVAGHDAHIVWSPFSNLLLYGRTLDLAALNDSRVLYAIGCDWAPTGSKNLLEELKVARSEVRRQAAPLTSRDLVAAVTANPARVLGWQSVLGSLRRGAFADMVIIAGTDGDPYDALIDAVETDIRLVITHGVGRFGEKDLVAAANVANRPLESVRIAGQPRSLQLGAPQSGLDDLTFEAARGFLAQAMSDLPAFHDSAQGERAAMRARGIDPDDGFTVALDNEFDVGPDGSPALRDGPMRADWSHLPKSIELDDPLVGVGTYWDRLDRQHNLDDSLRTVLAKAYGRG